MKQNLNRFGLVFIVLILIPISIICVKKDIEMLLIAILLFIPIFIFFNKKPKLYVYTQLIYNLIIKYLISSWGVPSIANYVTDIITLLCVWYAMIKCIKNKEKVNFKPQMLIVILMFISTIVGFFINGSEITLYLWGFRNIYRFFAFFFASIILLDKEDFYKFFKIFKIFLLINVFLCTYQYFIQHLGQDAISGTFGTISGGNAGMNLFLIIVTTVEVIYYLNRKTTMINLIFVIVSSIYIATISELKVFYIEFLIIVSLAVLLNNFNKRTFIIVVGAICISIVAVRTLYVIYPSFKNFFNINKILDYSAEGGYSDEKNLNRFTAIEEINKLYMFKNIETKMFGIGMGNAEVSQYDFLSSEFYEQYSYLAYNWFSHAFMYIENGYVGLILYILFFISITIKSHSLKNRDKNNKIYYIITEITSILAIVNMIYNGSLRMEYAYIYFVVLSLTFVCNKKSEIMN